MTTTPELATEPWPEIDWLDPDAQPELAPAAGPYAAAKPVTDYLLAVLILVPALPVIGLCWLLVRATSRGPGFYTQTRTGRNGRPYKIVKLRTMYHNCEARSGIRWAAKGDRRVTRVGRVLRAMHLDELPQLVNVLRGEMSLVGPRPERPEVIRAKGLCDRVPGYTLRLLARPGMTGLAQLQLPSDTDLTSVRRKVAYDLYYLANRTLWLDLRILAATALKAAGVGPRPLRWLFWLPGRGQVAAVFRNALTPPAPPELEGSARFLPV